MISGASRPFKGLEIVPADQSLGGAIHRAHVEARSHMPASAPVQHGTHGTAEDCVAVELGGGGHHVESTFAVFGAGYYYIVWETVVNSTFEILGWDDRIRLENRHLAESAYASVGSACAVDGYFFSDKLLDRFDQFALDGFKFGLSLPAVIATTVVGNRQFYIEGLWVLLLFRDQ